MLCTNYDCENVKRGNWCPWAQWTPCSVTCGSQSRSRIKKCECPSPAGDSVAGCENYSDKISNEVRVESPKISNRILKIKKKLRLVNQLGLF